MHSSQDVEDKQNFGAAVGGHYLTTFSRGPLPNQYYIVECKGSQSNRSTIINQLQRGSEQVLAVDIDKPASATRLVIGAWLKGTVTILVIDPPDDKLRKVSHWSANDLSSFARAKLLTHIGDYAKARY